MCMCKKRMKTNRTEEMLRENGKIATAGGWCVCAKRRTKYLSAAIIPHIIIYDEKV